MRRRLKAGEPPPELLSFDEWGASLGVFVAKDLTPLKLPSLSDYREAAAARLACWEQWVAARKRFDQSYGWPGGEAARERGEGGTYPGAPFDPADI